MNYKEQNDTFFDTNSVPQITSVEELQQQLKVAAPEKRLKLLSTAVNYSEAGIDLLVSSLNNDPYLCVRERAYQCLQNAIAQPLEPALKRKIEDEIERGIPLRKGDRIYCVYKFHIGYNDETYYLCDHIPEDATGGDYLDWIEPPDYQNMDWEDDYDELIEIYDTAQLISRHLSKQSAQETARALHLEEIQNPDTPNPFEFDWIHDRGFQVNDWRAANGLPPLQYSDDDWWEASSPARSEIIRELIDNRQIELLAKLWEETVGMLAIVDEQIIDRDCYFKITQHRER